MKYLRVLALIALTATLFASCEEVMEIDESKIESPLVLNAMPSNGQQMFVNFTRTRFFLADTYKPLSNATISLLVNNTPVAVDSVSGCNYFFGYTAAPGDSLRITASHNGQTATASTYVPYMPTLNNVSARLDSSLFHMVMIKFQLADIADLHEMYHINVVERDSGLRRNIMTGGFDTIDTTFNPYFICNDRLITDPSVAAFQPFGGFFYQRILCSDSLIDGRNYNVTLMVLKLVDTTEVKPFSHSYSLNFESVTPERFDYLCQVANASNSNTMFAEPSQVKGNINGALGVFAGTAKQLIPLNLDSTIAPSTPPMISDPQAVLDAYRRLCK
ncbi:MAG: DUF4249 domain-containing protein [Bacteroidales bacterium]|nr:DUF4249 domain-containing protein [Bacteroidales bacterium]